MLTGRILRDMEKAFIQAKEDKDYKTVDALFEEFLPNTTSQCIEKKLNNFLDKLKQEEIITQKQMVDYKSRQIKYLIDNVKEKYVKKE